MRHAIQALAVLFLFLAVLLASSAASAQVIQACAHKQTGVLRLVSDPAECGQNESAVSWNQVGPMGAQGEPGATGMGAFAFVDAEGQFVGHVLSFSSERASILVPENGGFRWMQGTPDVLIGGDLLYTTLDCSGQAYEKPREDPENNFFKLGFLMGFPSTDNDYFLFTQRPGATPEEIQLVASYDRPAGLGPFRCHVLESPQTRTLVPFDFAIRLQVVPPFSVVIE
jgi:hypothetical protein